MKCNIAILACFIFIAGLILGDYTGEARARQAPPQEDEEDFSHETLKQRMKRIRGEDRPESTLPHRFVDDNKTRI